MLLKMLVLQCILFQKHFSLSSVLFAKHNFKIQKFDNKNNKFKTGLCYTATLLPSSNIKNKYFLCDLLTVTALI